MTRIETLQTAKVNLEEQKTKLQEKQRQLESDRDDRLSRVYHEYFGDVLEEGDVLEVGRETLYFKRPQEGYSYDKEILTLYFKPENWRDEEVYQIETSFYSTNENSQFELRRMILLGKVGQILLDFKDDIIAAYNKVISETKDQISEVISQKYDLQGQITEINKKVREIEKQNLLSKVEGEGITITLPEGKSYHNLPRLDVKFDWSAYYVKGLRILSKTASGKSADIEITQVNNVWNTETKKDELVERKHIVEKVRMNKIEEFLQDNKERISAS